MYYMKLKFVIDKQYDFDIFIRKLREANNIRVMSEVWGVKESIIKRLQEQYSDIGEDLISELKGHVNNVYSRSEKYMNNSKELYQRSWDEIIDQFSADVEKLTDHKWYHDEFLCVVSAFHTGISNWGGNKIVRIWNENHYTQRRITAHEILISHYFSIYYEDYGEFNLTDWQIWGLAEIFAWSITGLERSFIDNYWPWDVSGYYTTHNYPQLVDLQLEMKDIYLNRKSFDEYMREGISRVVKYADISA